MFCSVLYSQQPVVVGLKFYCFGDPRQWVKIQRWLKDSLWEPVHHELLQWEVGAIIMLYQCVSTAAVHRRPIQLTWRIIIKLNPCVEIGLKQAQSLQTLCTVYGPASCLLGVQHQTGTSSGAGSETTVRRRKKMLARSCVQARSPSPGSKYPWLPWFSLLAALRFMFGLCLVLHSYSWLKPEIRWDEIRLD